MNYFTSSISFPILQFIAAQHQIETKELYHDQDRN
uniref:Uncharacterized protein n=1 Tax=Salmonella phage vB_STmST313_KE31 TaxID=3161181 RepID=A0AAU8GII4_9CAUD